MRAGFTLIEVVLAISVITVGVGAFSALISQTLSFLGNAKYQAIATYLGQEGLEIARNIRDSNFLKIRAGLEVGWDDGLSGCGSQAIGCEADYSSSVLLLQDRFLNLADGFYSYGFGSQTPFKRKIFIDEAGEGEVNVIVQVSWQERGRSHKVSSATKLYNWLYSQ